MNGSPSANRQTWSLSANRQTWSPSAKRMNVNSRGCEPTERAMQKLIDPERVEPLGTAIYVHLHANLLSHRLFDQRTGPRTSPRKPRKPVPLHLGHPQEQTMPSLPHQWRR